MECSNPRRPVPADADESEQMAAELLSRHYSADVDWRDFRGPGAEPGVHDFDVCSPTGDVVAAVEVTRYTDAARRALEEALAKHESFVPAI